MPFTLPAPTTNVNGWAPIWANFLALAGAAFNTPSGTGFLHITGGVVDPTALSITKSIQAGAIAIAAGTSSNTYSLPLSVVVAKSFIVFGGFTVNSAGSSLNDMPYVVLTNTSTVTATRNSAGGDVTTVAFTVVEFN